MIRTNVNKSASLWEFVVAFWRFLCVYKGVRTTAIKQRQHLACANADIGTSEVAELLYTQVGIRGWWWQLDLHRALGLVPMPFAIVGVGAGSRLFWTVFVATWCLSAIAEVKPAEALDRARHKAALERLTPAAERLKQDPDWVKALQTGITAHQREELFKWLNPPTATNSTDA